MVKKYGRKEQRKRYERYTTNEETSAAVPVSYKSGAISAVPVLVGPCHHGMARPQVADRGTASDKEDSCE